MSATDDTKYSGNTVKMTTFFSKYWPWLRDYTLFVIGGVLLISPFSIYLIYGLFNEITSYELKNSTFFSILLIRLIPGLILGVFLFPMGLAQINHRKKNAWAPRLWMLIVAISILACAALLASYGIEGYCGERLHESCGEWH